MYRTIVLTVALALVFTACGGGDGPGATPEDTFNHIQADMKSGNWEAIVDYVPPSKLPEAEKQFKKTLESEMGLNMMAGVLGVKPEELKTMDFRTAMGKMLEKMMQKDSKEMDRIVNSTIKESKIDGKKATITVTHGDKTEEIELVEEDGRWYMADFGK